MLHIHICHIIYLLMSKVILYIRKFQRNSSQWLQSFTPKVDRLIDKYQLIKIGCVVGTVINSYLIYDGLMGIIVLRNVKHEVDIKKDMFYRRVENKKEQIFALMQELEQENLLSALDEKAATP